MLAVKSFNASSSFACKEPARVPLTSILPPDVMRSLSVPPVSAVIVSAAGNLIFVFVSPV